MHLLDLRWIASSWVGRQGSSGSDPIRCGSGERWDAGDWHEDDGLHQGGRRLRVPYSFSLHRGGYGQGVDKILGDFDWTHGGLGWLVAMWTWFMRLGCGSGLMYESIGW